MSEYDYENDPDIAIAPPKKTIVKEKPLASTGVEGQLEESNPELIARLDQAKIAYKEKFGKDLPITSKARTREQQKDLYNRWKKGEKGIYMPLNPDNYPNQKAFHTDAVDISTEVPDAFLKEFGLHRPLGKNDPVHTVIDPSFKKAAVEKTTENAPEHQNKFLKVLNTNVSPKDKYDYENDPDILFTPSKQNIEEKPYQPGYYNPNLVQQGENARLAGGGNLQPIVGGVDKALKSMSVEDWKKESLIANMLKYGVGSMPIVGDEAMREEGRQKLLQTGGAALHALTHPIETAKNISEAEPGEFIGNMIKGGIYDLPLAGATRPIEMAASAVGKPVLSATGKAVSATGKAIAPAVKTAEELREMFKNARAGVTLVENPEHPDFGGKPMSGVGAANVTKESSINALLPDLNPETQAFVKSQDLNKVNLPALETKALEEKHGIKLSKGQRTEDVSRYADEWNHRADNQKTQDLFTNQPEQFKTALEKIKEKHTPNLGDASGEDFGQNIMNAYASNDIQSLKNIENAYLTMKSRHNEILQERGLPPTSGMPLNTNQFVTSAKENLIQEFLADDAEKAGLTNDLKRIEQNGLTFPEFVAFDKKLSRIQRSGEGGQKAAAGAIKNAFDEIPLENGMEELSPMLQNAKQLAKQRFDKISDIPGYKFSIENMPTAEEIKSNIGSKNANKFYNTFINNASTGDLKRIKLELENHPKAIESIAGAELEKIVKKAGFTGDMGKFTPKNLNDYLVDNKANLSEKLTSEALNDLMEINVLGAKVAKPDAGVFNHSNSLSGLFSDFAKQGIQTKAEAALAGKTGGMSILPIGIAKKAYEFMNKDKFVNETIHPHSGLIEEK